MPRRQFTPFDDLPLFATDADLATAVVGTDPEKRAVWLAQVPILEARGFPKKAIGFGRYRPAVKAFYDRFYGIGSTSDPHDTSPGKLGEWKPRKGSKRPL